MAKRNLNITPDALILEDLQSFGVRNFTAFFETKAVEFIKECKLRRLEAEEKVNYVLMLCTCGATYSSKLNKCPGCNTTKAYAKVMREEIAKKDVVDCY